MSKKKILIKDQMINWKCLVDKCPRNCCGAYICPNNKLVSIFDVDEKLIPLTSSDYKILVSKGYKKFLFKQKDGGWYIKTKEDGTCPFLKNNQCAIYEIRGSSCRSYPFFFQKYNGLVADLSCPGWGKGWTSLGKIRKMVDKLTDLYSWQIDKAKNL